jgi:hypothetical protein
MTRQVPIGAWVLARVSELTHVSGLMHKVSANDEGFLIMTCGKMVEEGRIIEVRSDPSGGRPCKLCLTPGGNFGRPHHSNWPNNRASRGLD